MIKVNLNILSIIFFILLSPNFNGISQNSSVDSLLSLLNKEKTDTVKVQILQKIVDKFRYSKPDSSRIYIERALKLSEKNDYTKGIIDGNINLGIYYFYKSDYPKSLESLYKSLNISLDINDLKSASKIYNNIGITYFNLGAYKKALNLFQNSLKINEELKNEEEISSIYTNIGLVHEDMKNYELAKKYFESALKIKIKQNDSLLIGGVYNNLGTLYRRMNNDTLSLSYFYKALEAFKKINNIHGVSSIYNNVGQHYFKSNKFDSASQYFRNSYRIKENIGDKKGMATVLNNLCEVEYTKAKSISNKNEKNILYKKSLANAQKALQIGAELNVLTVQQKAYEHLTNIYLGKAEYKTAFDFNKKYLAIKDSLLNIDRIKEIANIEALYQTEKSEIEIDKLKSEKYIDKLELEKTKTGLLFLLFVIIFFIIIIIAMYLLIKRIQKKNTIINTQNDTIANQYKEIVSQNLELKRYQEHLEDLVKKRTSSLIEARESAEKADNLKSLFLESVSHEIRTPLNAIVGFSAILENEENLTQQTQTYVQKIINGSDTLLHVVDDIMQISKIQAGELRLNAEKFYLAILLKEQYNNFKRSDLYRNKEKIKLKLNIENTSDIYLKSDKKSVEKILRSLIDNAIKFTDTGSIVIGATIIDKSLCLYVKDTGIGISEEDKPYIFDRFRKVESNKNKLYSGVGLGLTISKNLADLINAKLWFKSERGQGSTFFLEFTQNSFGN